MKRNQDKISLWKRKTLPKLKGQRLHDLILSNPDYRPREMTVEERELINRSIEQADRRYIEHQAATTQNIDGWFSHVTRLFS